MKKIIFSLTLIIVFQIICPAQEEDKYYKDLSFYEYVKLPDSNAIWSEYEISYQGYEPELFPYYMLTVGDTAINSKTYTQVYRSFDTIWNLQADIYWGSYRQDSNKSVYLVPKDSINEILLYDFSGSVGDTIWINEFDAGLGYVLTPYIIDEIDTIFEGGASRKVFNFNPQTSYYTIFPWIEGIGSMAGIFYHLYPKTIGGWWELNCLTYMDQAVFQNPESWFPDCFPLTEIRELSANEHQIFIEAYPSPAKDFVTFEINKLPNDQIPELQVFDMHGHEVFRAIFINQELTWDVQAFPDGIYFYRTELNGELVSGKVIIHK